MATAVILVIISLAAVVSATTNCTKRELCDGFGLRAFIGATVPKEEFLRLMSEEFCGCRIVDRSINIFNRPVDEIYSSIDFEFLSSVEEIGDTLLIENLNLTDNITLPNLRLIRGRNLLEFLVQPNGNPAIYIHNVTGPVYLPKLTEITLGDVYIQTVSFCNHRGVLWEDILTEPGSRYEDIGNDHCNNTTPSRNCSHCEYGYCWSSDLCQTLTKNFSTCSTDCSNRRCYLNAEENPQCCSRECAAGCIGPRDDQCIACENFDNDGTCVADCPPRLVYDPLTESFETNDDFRFHSGSLCVESCPSNRFEQGTFCVSECQVGFQPMGRVCESCPNGVCVGGRTCRGVDEHFLPGDVQRFSGCVIVNGDLIFNRVTYEDFIDSTATNLSQARMSLSDIEIILGQLVISNWGEAVFDYLPNLMYIGGFEGNSSLADDALDSLVIVDNNPFNNNFESSSVSLNQIHFPKLVEISGLDIYLLNNPNLCYIGELEYYKTSSNQTVIYSTFDDTIPRKSYSDCVAEGMSCHEQCNETYRCWGPADTDCVVCNVYLYRNGSERICVNSCNSPRLNLFLYADKSSRTCRACHEECSDSCSGPGPTHCFGRCKNFALPTANNTITCVSQCPITTYPNASNFCLPCNSVCVPTEGCTGSSNRLEEGGCNRCYFVHRYHNLTQIECLQDMQGCIEKTYLNLPFDPVEPFPFPTRFCDSCHEQCLSCNGPDATDCSECVFALRDGACVGSCEDGEYESGKRCLLCHEECDGCTGGSQQDCIACKNVKNFLGDGGRFECLASGSCPTNTFENMINSTCDECHPNCAECIGTSFENCTRCNNPPGYTIIPPEDDDPGLFGCCDDGSMAVEENQTCIPIEAAPQTGSSEETPVGPVIGGALGGLVLIIILLLIVIFTARGVYRCYFVSAKYDEEAGQLENPLYGVSPFAEMKAEDILQPPKVAPNQARLIIVPETALELGKELGSGAFGTVYKGYWTPEGDAHKYTVAIKVMNENTSAQSQTELLQEGVTMASIDNEFVVRLFCVCLGSKMMLVSEFVPFGALIDHLKKFKADLNAKALLTFATQIASGMKYLESIRMVHRDLAARNVLVQGPEHVKITDFGLTKILDVGETTFKSTGGKVPVRWLAPESLRHRLYTHKSDVWAYGVTVWEVLTFGARPYPNKQARELLGALQSGERLNQPETCTLDLYAVLLQCWLLDPEARPTFEELETRMSEFLSDPLRYILTVVDDRLETYANLPTNILNTGESPYESPFLLSGGEASGYEMPSPLNTLTESATPEYDNFKENELAESQKLLPKGRKDIYDPNFLKSGDYEQPLQGLDGDYGKIRDSTKGPDDSYGDLNDVSVGKQDPTINEYLKPGDSLGHDYQNPVGHEVVDDGNHEYHEVDEDRGKQSKDGDDDHEYHEVDEDKIKQQDDEDGDHEYHELDEDKKDDGYEHPPNFDHEYHVIPDFPNNTATLDSKSAPDVEFDSPEYGLFRNQSQEALLNSNQNNNNNNSINKDGEYMHVTDDMLLPPHERGNTLPNGLTSSATEL